MKKAVTTLLIKLKNIIEETITEEEHWKNELTSSLIDHNYATTIYCIDTLKW